MRQRLSWSRNDGVNEYDIRMPLENDSVLKERVEKAMDVNIDFLERVKHGFKSKSD